MVKIPIKEPDVDDADKLADSVQDQLITSMLDKEQGGNSWFPDITFGKASKKWDEYDGQITHLINDMDPDFAQAKLGQSCEMCADSLGVVIDSPLVCLAISGIHVAALKIMGPQKAKQKDAGVMLA